MAESNDNIETDVKWIILALEELKQSIETIHLFQTEHTVTKDICHAKKAATNKDIARLEKNLADRIHRNEFQPVKIIAYGLVSSLSIGTASIVIYMIRGHLS